MHMKETMLIFDLDGTLWDSGQGVADSWNEVLEEKYPEYAGLTAEDVHAVMGRTMDEIAMALMPEADPGLRRSVFDECMAYENEYLSVHGGELFEQVRQALESLKAAGYEMSIVSNCQSGYINAFLESMNMGKYFCDYEEWGRTGLLKSENIRLVMERNGFESAVYIGDTAGDEAAARQAHIPFIYAAYGFGRADAPDAVLEKFSALPQVIESMLSKQR